MEIGAIFSAKRNEIGLKRVQALARELRIEQKDGSKYGFGPGSIIQCCREVADRVELPRQFALWEGLAEGATDATVEGESAAIRFTQALRPEQGPLIAEFLERLRAPRNRLGGIFSAPCGTGKTVMALRMLAEIGRPAIILVHTGALMKQWQEAIAKFTNLPPEQVGMIQQDTCEWEGRQIVVAMVESLISNRAYPPAMFRRFGVVVLDEVHRHAAEVWGQAAQMFPARLRIGLSATPRRADGLWNIIRWHVGEVLVKAKGQGGAKVFMVPTGVALPLSVWQGYHGAEVNLARLINALAAHPQRNDLIVDELCKAMQRGRRVLVLTDRLEHIRTLSAMFELLWEGDPVRIGQYVGGMSGEDIERSRKCGLVFGTYQYAKEGLDDPGLDTLFLATPKSDVEQPIGRILRTEEGKKEPVVVDFVDEGTPPCVGFAQKRRWQYKRLEFEVKDLTPAQA